MNIQWYPGHMTKTRRQIESDLKQVDAVCEIVDARIPISSRNPDIDSICTGKPRIIILNRMDLADASATKKWLAYFREKGMASLATDCKTKRGISDFQPAVRSVLKEKIARNEARGMNRPVRVMIVGIPNVGKSTLINQISGRKGAKAENRPGVTRGKQWVTVDTSLQLLDTPGILWPKFEDKRVGENLAITGAIKDNVLQSDEIAMILCAKLKTRYPDLLCERFSLKKEEIEDLDGYDIFEKIGKARHILMRGGEVDFNRCATMILDEFRSAKIGRITLE